MGIIKGIFLGILEFLLLIVIIIVVGVGTIIAFFLAQLLLLGDKNYLLFTSNSNNIIAVIMIVFLAIYGVYKLDEKLSKGKGKIFAIKANSLMRKFDIAPKYFKIIYSIGLLVAIYCGVTGYAALYEDGIKVGSPLTPVGVVYEYSDVESIKVGIKKPFGKSYVPYYNIKFNDNKVVDLLGGSGRSEQEGKFAEDILLNLDNQLKTHGVTKRVNKDNFNKYSKGLDKDFVKKIEKLFVKY